MLLQDFPVDDVLAAKKQTQGPVVGARLVENLKNGIHPSDQESRFLIKVLGRHLMHNCQM